MGNLFILISIGFNVVGQFLLKSGVNKLGQLSFDFTHIVKAFLSPFVLIGLFAYFVGSIFWILALSHKDLSYAYPMLSIGYLLIVLISWAFLNEQVSLLRIGGVVLVSFGLFLVFKSA